jgi:phage-related protein
MPAYESFPTTVIGPSYPLDVQYEPRVLRVEFGDGYTQESPDGLNHMLGKYELTWEVLLPAERDEIKAFLEDRGGYQTFEWDDPESVTHRIKCRSWSIQNTNPGVYSMKATFQEVPY